MSHQSSKIEKVSSMPRPPVVAVMGHIDHGKSTLLDYIRKTNTVDKEAGGITQHLGAYEVSHTPKDGIARAITFLDTPGHAAFQGIRARGAIVADIAVLVVSGEDGVKPQTIEALQSIKKENLAYVVAITKIDKPQASVERTKQSLAEHEIYIEGYGGDIPCVPISSKTGEGVAELLDMILLVADLKGVTMEADASPTGYIIESDVSKQNGICATAIITNGILKKGVSILAEEALALSPRLQNALGKPITEVSAGLPVRIIGWSRLPRGGAPLEIAGTKREAEERIESFREKAAAQAKKDSAGAVSVSEKIVIPLVIKADAAGSLEALEHEIKKLETDKVRIKIIHSGMGAVSEGDAKTALGARDAYIIGFNVPTDAQAKQLIERDGLTAVSFDIIYKLGEWLAEKVKERTPKEKVEEVSGNARILKVFNTEKDRQILGGKVLDGELGVGNEFKIWRREAHIGKGKIRELQKFKEKVPSVLKDAEFGTFVNSTIEIMPGDRIEAFTVIER